MKNYESFLAVLSIITTCVAISSAQWTPDPFCPYPSFEITRYPYYGNCSVFWECFEGTKYTMECPEGLEFNAPLQQCDTPSIANCDPYAPTTGNPNPPTTSSNGGGPTCPYPSEEIIYFPYDGDCTKYWECFEGNHYLYNCPSGLWWHQAISQCDYPGDFCDNTGPTPPTIGPTVAPPECPNPLPDTPVYFPYDGDCTKYWECSTDGLILLTCPDELWWHQSIGQCDYPGDFCYNGTGPTPTPVGPTEPPPECPNPLPDTPVYFPYGEADCRKYWECSENGLILLTCPDDLWWHQAIGACDYPDGFCGADTSNTYPTAIPPPQCPNPLPDYPVYYPYGEADCTKYWECSTTGIILLTCPDGLWWHQAMAQCDFPGDFCNDDTTGTYPTPVPPPECPDPLPDKPVYFPYGDVDCTKYWECSSTGIILLTCPDQLWWHQAIEQCDYPDGFCGGGALFEAFMNMTHVADIKRVPIS